MPTLSPLEQRPGRSPRARRGFLAARALLLCIVAAGLAVIAVRTTDAYLRAAVLLLILVVLVDGASLLAREWRP